MSRDCDRRQDPAGRSGVANRVALHRSDQSCQPEMGTAAGGCRRSSGGDQPRAGGGGKNGAVEPRLTVAVQEIR